LGPDGVLKPAKSKIISPLTLIKVIGKRLARRSQWNWRVIVVGVWERGLSANLAVLNQKWNWWFRER
jgi:hypothetical protein